MSAHTPTPWEADDYAHDVEIGTPDGITVCRLHKDMGQAAKATANAAHIVRCVNSHDALVAALKQIADFDVYNADGMRSLARRALALAEAA